MNNPNVSQFPPRSTQSRRPRRRQPRRLARALGQARSANVSTSTVARGNNRRRNSRPTRRVNRQNSSTIGVPSALTSGFKTYFSMAAKGVSFCQAIPILMIPSPVAIVPLHPAMFTGRIFNIAQNFGKFKVVRASLHWVPLVGTSTAGSLVIAHLPECTPIDRDTSLAFANLTQLDSQIGPVWCPMTHPIMKADNEYHPMCLSRKQDVPQTFMAALAGTGTAMYNLGNLFLEAEFAFDSPVANVEINSVASPGTFTTSAAGVRSTVATILGTWLVVNASTVPSIDLGELVFVPGIALVATDYLCQILHNGQTLDPVNVVNDRGTFTGLAVYMN